MSTTPALEMRPLMERICESLEDHAELTRGPCPCGLCERGREVIRLDAELRRLREALGDIQKRSGMGPPSSPKDPGATWYNPLVTCHSIAKRALSGTPEDATASRLVARIKDLEEAFRAGYGYGFSDGDPRDGRPTYAEDLAWRNSGIERHEKQEAASQPTPEPASEVER